MTIIYFRADGNQNIATGHLMRCLTIARACIQIGRQTGQEVQISFLVSDNQSRSLLEDRFEVPDEFSIYSLNSDYRHMEMEVSDLLTYIADDTAARQNRCADTDYKRPWLFVDSYYASPDYFRRLSGHCKIAYLDDLRSCECPVDLIINYDTDEDCSCYANAARRLLGVQYTPLRAQFQSPSYTVRPEALHIFLSTGGTDPYGMAEHLLHTIYAYPDSYDNRLDNTNIYPIGPRDVTLLQSLQYHIVTSKANTRYHNLLTLMNQNPHIHLHENVLDMASLMASCDIAVSAGGTTLSELCAVGVPTISYLMADNQRTAVDNFAAENIIPCAGDIRNCLLPDNAMPSQTPSLLSSDSIIINILQFIISMANNPKLRQKSSHKMRAFLDGRGAGRIADALLSF